MDKQTEPAARRVRLRPRLLLAAELLSADATQYGTAADVGCDHGRLAAALLQRGSCARVIASDVSADSLAKARVLALRCGLSDRLLLRQCDGLNGLAPGEADAIALCGMGGELIARILQSGEAAAQAAARIVCQPMRGEAALRRFLRQNGYRTEREGVVLDAGRYYQVLTAAAGEPEAPPPGWPAGYDSVGYRMFAERDPLLAPMLRYRLAIHERRAEAAAAHGKRPAELLFERDCARKLLEMLEEKRWI